MTVSLVAAINILVICFIVKLFPIGSGFKSKGDNKMLDFLNDIMEAMTKKHIIIGAILLAFIIACVVAIIMLCSSTRDISSTVKAERTIQAEVYTLEIESAAEVSAESIYQKLASNNGELKLLSMESDRDPHVVSLSADTVIDSSLEICFSDGNFKKNFTTAGEYEETLIVHNQVDQSMSSLTVKLMVTEAEENAKITAVKETTEAVSTSKATKASKASKTSRTSRITVSSAAVKSTVVAIANDYDSYDNYDHDNSYYDYEEDYYDYDSEYSESGYDQSDYYYNDYNDYNDYDYSTEESGNDYTYNEPASTEPNTDSTDESNFKTAEDFGWTGEEAEWFNYALSQGCNVWQASAYANACANYGEENIFIGLTPADSTCWGVWYYDESTETYRAA